MTATTLILCAYRGVSVPTHHAIVQLMRNNPDWDEVVVEQAPINRARSFAASQWYRDKPDEDVFLMVDDDILFQWQDAVRMVEACRGGCDIIGAAYPFRDGSGIAVRPLPGDTTLSFGDGLPPHEVRHIGTGFFAMHRDVIEALIPTLPLCSDRQMGSEFWPLFQDEMVDDAEAKAGRQWLTEDYFICDHAREIGFHVWLEPSIFLAHYGQVPVTLTNREMVQQAIKGTFASGPAVSELAANLDAARSALAAEWTEKNPRTPDEIAAFYRTAEHIGEDLEAWHLTPARQEWTRIVVEVARQIKAQTVIDIGCGAGHELRALRTAGVPKLIGVEPNDLLRGHLKSEGFEVYLSSTIVIADADLLICLDVLEHVSDPEAFLADIAERAKHNAVLIESTATFDEGTPLHLEANRGWEPQGCLARHGWGLQAEHQGRVRVWQKCD